MLIVRFIIEHGGTGEPARAQFVIKIDVLLILGKIVEMVFKRSVLFHREGERNKFDIVFLDEIMIQIARGIR